MLSSLSRLQRMALLSTTLDYKDLGQADLVIDGRQRQVIMQAPKNGFFYVLDAATGKFISGKPFIDGINWATGLDPVTGYPQFNPAADGSWFPARAR